MIPLWPWFAAPLLSVVLAGLALVACGTVPKTAEERDFEECGQYPDRQDLGTFQIITTCAKRVSDHCHKRIRKTGAKHDNSDEVKVGEEIRACTDYKNPKKPTIFRSRKHRRCDKHEAGHAKLEGPAAWVEINRPCLGESK